ncbi:uncharacterized protein DS421_13g436040 [Arachis hypogaea]|nr:uncharacterized protein DS421_13g436040 [Arachis hypogaea]
MGKRKKDTGRDVEGVAAVVNGGGCWGRGQGVVRVCGGVRMGRKEGRRGDCGGGLTAARVFVGGGGLWWLIVEG